MQMTAVAPIRWLLGRRNRRGTWAYVIWVIPYILTAWLFAGEIAFHAGARPYQMVPLLIPVLIVAAQIAYPTLLGWTVIFIPSVAYCSCGLYYLVRNATERPAQWENDLAGFLLGSFFVGAYLFVCVCLVFARPRPASEVNAGPGASPNGGPAVRPGSAGTGGGQPSVS
jgi:hypothetical protein